MSGSKSVVLLVGVAAIAVILAWTLLNQDRFQETPTRVYRDFETAKLSGALEKGWLPDSLPMSAKNIHEKHNFDYNRVIISFALDESDIPAMLKQARDVLPNRFKEIAPTWVYRNEKWFPKQIVSGDMHELVRDGFRVYEFGSQYTNRISGHKILKWFILIHPKKSIAYVWS